MLLSGRETAFEYSLIRAAGWPKFLLGEEGAELTAEEDAHIIQVAGSIDRCEFYSPQVFRLFEEHMGPYFEGKEPFSQCAQALSRALAKYLQGGK